MQNTKYYLVFNDSVYDIEGDTDYIKSLDFDTLKRLYADTYLHMETRKYFSKLGKLKTSTTQFKKLQNGLNLIEEIILPQDNSNEFKAFCEQLTIDKDKIISEVEKNLNT